MYDDLHAGWRQLGEKCPDFDTFWKKGLAYLAGEASSRVMFEAFRQSPAEHPLTTPSGRIEIFSEAITSFNLPDCKG